MPIRDVRRPAAHADAERLQVGQFGEGEGPGMRGAYQPPVRVLQEGDDVPPDVALQVGAGDGAPGQIRPRAPKCEARSAQR